MIPKKQPALLAQGQWSRQGKPKRSSSKRGWWANPSMRVIVEFIVPEKTKWLAGKGDKMSGRLVVVDTKAYRTSAITADKILSLRAQKKPLNLLLIGGLTFGGVVLVLLLINVFRGGGRGRRGAPPRAPMPPPQPGAGGGGYPPVR